MKTSDKLDKIRVERGYPEKVEIVKICDKNLAKLFYQIMEAVLIDKMKRGQGDYLYLRCKDGHEDNFTEVVNMLSPDADPLLLIQMKNVDIDTWQLKRIWKMIAEIAKDNGMSFGIGRTVSSLDERGYEIFELEFKQGDHETTFFMEP